MALTRIPGLGPVTWRKLAGKLGGADKVLGVSRQRLIHEGASKKVASAIASFSDWEQVDQCLARLREIGGRIIGYGEPDYPANLVPLHDPPMALFVRGTLEPGDALSLAMVGTRKPGGYGKRIARKLAFQIASSGVTVVSGLALGIDTESHKGALDAGGRTLAVLGSGLDVPSPPSNRSLAEKIANNGAVISEFPPGTEPFPGNFPRRNRILAGLATAVMVVQMPGKSGAHITASFALEQGKDVLVVPGPIDDAGFAGSFRLLRDGALPVFEAMDALEAVLPQEALRAAREKPIVKKVSHGRTTVKLPADQGGVLELLTSDPIHLDEIVSRSGLTIEKVLTILLELELRNLIEQMPGKRFRRND